ncbi:hypothetical protein KSP39_PZI003539 [Platanthera zijinensis]|uniref:Uncharacterized protein n=1 Tax=Platanthera zijinensis TaxID=2320716 RepID=A0AAP0GC42_9ASPA
MGSFCSKNSAVDKSPSDVTFSAGNRKDNGKVLSPSPLKSFGDLKCFQAGDSMGKRSLEQSFSFSEGLVPSFGCNRADISAPTQPALSRVHSEKFPSTKPKASPGGRSGAHKVSEVSSLLGRASTAGFGKAVEVLDTLGSSMTNLNINSAFSSGVATKGNQISILAFEVANTIVKGANFMHSLSEENIKHLKEVVLPSEAVQRIVSKDNNELLRIAAADKREELKIFSGEVVRFGNRCRDPQWHNLDRYFAKLDLESTPLQQLKEQATGVMQQLLTLVQYTAELYHELHALDRFDQDYRRKIQEDENSGESFQILRHELKSQGKHVKGLKKKSLWSRNLEEVMEKLVDIVHFMHFEIHEAFGSADGDKPEMGSLNSHQRLGPAGLALHYANIINQIDTLVSRSGSVPPNMRDSLYQNLPPPIKSALRWKLQVFQLDEEMTAPEIKAEMEKTLQWLVPIANNTTKVHHGFGWVGEWANTGVDVSHKPTGHTNLLRVETLYHADKENTDACILDLIVWLHHFINLSRRGKAFLYARSPIKSPIHPYPQESVSASLLRSNQPSPTASVLTQEEQEMVIGAALSRRSLRSKSQDFDAGRRKFLKSSRLCRSGSNSPTSLSKNESRKTSFPVIDFDTNLMKALFIDRVDGLRRL